MVKHFQFSRRQFMQWSAAGAVASVARPAAALNPASSENVVGRAKSAATGPAVSRLQISNPARIKALQLTDIHYFGSTQVPALDRKTNEDLPRLLDVAQPDLVMLTGDLWHENPDGNGREYMEYGVAQLEKLGVPWLFVWGNHDKLDDYASGHDYLAAAKGSLYAGGATGGNYVVELADAAGAVRWELPCLNSSEVGVDAPVLDWLNGLAAERGEAKRVPALGVVHIPLTQYQDIWDEGISEGIKLESVASWETEPTAFEAWKQACGLRGVVCGHDHINNYSGVYEDVELVYGQATGSAGYGGDTIPKGGRLYTFNAESGSFASEVLFPDGTRWNAPEGWSTEAVLDIPWDTHKKRMVERRKRLFGDDAQ
ncbi:MAG: hypothetical protein GC168_06915 [Candidatus Hydrogenedens sp.]|nr:hypothetical protein [Candidatus Hydrogenedens sp.]